MDIEHKLEPIEHWIVDGKAYRLATEKDLWKTVLVADLEISKRMSLPEIERTLEGIRDSQYRFEAGGTAWMYAYVQDNSLLAPQQSTETSSTTKPIDWTKPVRTKDGRSVRVLCTNGPGKYPVAGYVEGEYRPRTWLLDGVELIGTVGPCDLENAPQRIQREYWVNVYEDSGYDAIHNSAKHAAEFRNTKRKCLACVTITIDCEKGEGL